MLLLSFLITLSILTYPSTNWAESTQYILKDQSAPFSGFIVDESKLKICVTAVQDANYLRDLNKLKDEYYTQRLADQARIAALELEIKTKEDAAVEAGLKKELKSKTVFYKQYWFTIPATALVFILTGGLIP